MSLRLKIKLEIVAKERIIFVPNSMNSLIELIKEKDNLFLPEDSIIREGGSFFYSEKIVKWADELYYLFEKVKKEDATILDISIALDSVKVSATPKVVEDVRNKLDVFLKIHENYTIDL